MRGQDDRAAGWAASTLGWWEEAGVDVIVGESRATGSRRKAKARRRAARRPAARCAARHARRLPGLAGRDRSAALRRAGARRAAPAGDPAAGLMVLTDMPSPRTAG